MDLSGGYRDFTAPCYWPGERLLAVVAASLLALAPAFAFGVYCVLGQKYAALAWALPATLAFIAGTPNLNCIIGFPWALCAGIGLALMIFYGPLHLVGGLLPSVTWLLASAIKGTTMMSMKDRLIESAEAYKRLKEADVLFFRGN
jgi:hypothetical protein